MLHTVTSESYIGMASMAAHPISISHWAWSKADSEPKGHPAVSIRQASQASEPSAPRHAETSTLTVTTRRTRIRRPPEDFGPDLPGAGAEHSLILWWLTCAVVWADKTCVQRTYGLMEALTSIKQHTQKCRVGILWYDWSEYVYEIGDAVDTSLVGLRTLIIQTRLSDPSSLRYCVVCETLNVLYSSYF